MREKFKLAMTVATLVARNAKEAVVTPMAESGGRFCVGAFGQDIFTFPLLHKEI
jgi:hypothetical protein